RRHVVKLAQALLVVKPLHQPLHLRCSDPRSHQSERAAWLSSLWRTSEDPVRFISGQGQFLPNQCCWCRVLSAGSGEEKDADESRHRSGLSASRTHEISRVGVREKRLVALL